jgi:hypothetical protein
MLQLGGPPTSKSEFTTGFPASKYKLVFTLSETFNRGRYTKRYSHRRLVAGGRSHLVHRHRSSPGSVQGRRQPSGVPVTPSSAMLYTTVTVLGARRTGSRTARLRVRPRRAHGSTRPCTRLGNRCTATPHGRTASSDTQSHNVHTVDELFVCLPYVQPWSRAKCTRRERPL